ncbi:MAG: hypothetical protein NVS2B12_27710 [Ktedonobacteraceae bacterium]
MMKNFVRIYVFNPVTVIAFGLLLRFLLLVLGWPHSNADESTVGEMAMNIAFHGDHPVFFYGQEYMGALQAYLGAALFTLSGASVFNLRVAQLLLVAIFLISIYLLTRILYDRKLALFVTLLVGCGNYLTIYRETQAIGGYPDTLAFGALVFLLASWLALTSPAPGQTLEPELRRRRWLAFAGWGLAAGLGLWSDLLVVPSLVMSGLLLLLICWRELRSLAPLVLVAGLVVGALPLILFNVTAAPGHDSITTLRQLYNHGDTPLLLTLPQTLKSALLVGLPTFSNFPAVCSVSDTLFMGGHGGRAVLCALAQGSWSGVVVALWVSALALAASTIVRNWRRRQAEPVQEPAVEQRRASVVALARGALLLSAGMTFALYATSTTAIYEPYLSSRYLIAILIATPALLYPVWHAGAVLTGPRTRNEPRKLTTGISRALLAAIAGLYLLGTLLIFATVPGERMQNQQEVALVQNMSRLGVRHVHSDFWTCDNLIFISQARILCDTTNEQMQSSGVRYQPFGEAVRADPRSDYIFPISSPLASACPKFLDEHGQRYQRYTFNNYVLYKLV